MNKLSEDKIMRGFNILPKIVSGLIAILIATMPMTVIAEDTIPSQDVVIFIEQDALSAYNKSTDLTVEFHTADGQSHSINNFDTSGVDGGKKLTFSAQYDHDNPLTINSITDVRADEFDGETDIIPGCGSGATLTPDKKMVMSNDGNNYLDCSIQPLVS